jgi:uncharacterized protein DUF6941
MNSEKPMAVAMMICDQIISEERTHKKTLVGCFNNINAMAFPALHPTFYVFVAITNGQGNYRSKLRCVYENGQQATLFEFEGSLNLLQPMQTAEVAFKLVNLTFPKPGTYAIEFWCDDELLLQRRISVSQLTGKA